MSKWTALGAERISNINTPPYDPARHPKCRVISLLTDLQHYCEANGIDFKLHLEMSHRFYEREKGE